MNAEIPIERDQAAPYAPREPATGGAASGDPDTADTRRRWTIAALLFAALLIAVVAAYWFVTSGADEAEEEAPSADVVSVITPGRATIEGVIEASGTIAARRPMPIGAVGEGGRVTSVTVDAGDFVRAGQVLAYVDQGVQAQQLESASANIRVAQADLDLAQANLDRALKLVDRGFISQADVDRLTATRDAARARVQVARAQRGELQARTSRLNVVAPAAGLVLERNVEPGQTIGPGSGALFTIARGGEMEMLAEIGESELARLSVGNEATVRPVGLDRAFTGQIWQLAPTIDETDRQGTARIALSYASGLRPGGFATARIASGTLVAPVLPESAVQSDDEGAYVYIVNQANEAVRQAVELGRVTPDGITIVGGLTGSERVVLRAAGFLTEGQTVKPNLIRAAGRSAASGAGG